MVDISAFQFESRQQNTDNQLLTVAGSGAIACAFQMRAECSHSDSKLIENFFVAFAGQQQSHDFGLTSRKLQTLNNGIPQQSIKR